MKRMRFRDALLDFDDLAVFEGGWARLSTFRKHFATLVGGRDVQALDMLPFSTTAFDLKSMRADILSEGPLELVCFASGAFPPLFPPVHIGSSLYTDVAFFTDASGCRGLQTSPESRVLQVCHADVPFNGPWVVESPSSLNVREVCSVVVNGQHARRAAAARRAGPRRRGARRGARGRRRRLGPSLGARRAGPLRLPRVSRENASPALLMCWRCRRSSPAWRGRSSGF